MRCQNPALSANAKVLWALCEMSINIYGIDVISSTKIAHCVGLSKYKVLQVLHTLKKAGLVERASMGCPAVFCCGEYKEMVCDAKPPINGWTLTDKGRNGAVYKRAQEDYLHDLENIAHKEE